jgi:hypothetical protein
MLLSEQEKGVFRHFLGLLLDAEEPEAMLAVLLRLAERKAQAAIRGVMIGRPEMMAPAISALDAARWERLAEALGQAQAWLDSPGRPNGGGGRTAPTRSAE